MSSGGMRDMAELLRSGARMLSQSCPECGSPLFQLKSGDIWCAKCQRRVIIISEGEDVAVEAGLKLESIERAIVDKLSSMEAILSRENDPASLKGIAEVLDALLAALERLKRIRKG